jgi:hypothetical protein
MARGLCLDRELLFVISFGTLGAWERLRLDCMIRWGMCVQRPWQFQLEVREFELLDFFLKISASVVSAVMV